MKDIFNLNIGGQSSKNSQSVSLAPSFEETAIKLQTYKRQIEYELNRKDICIQTLCKLILAVNEIQSIDYTWLIYDFIRPKRQPDKLPEKKHYTERYSEGWMIKTFNEIKEEVNKPCPGLYFVNLEQEGAKDNHVIYIGISQNIYKRVLHPGHPFRLLSNEFKDEEKMIVYLSFLEVRDKKKYEWMEKIAIRCHKPVMNMKHNGYKDYK